MKNAAAWEIDFEFDDEKKLKAIISLEPDYTAKHLETVTDEEGDRIIFYNAVPCEGGSGTESPETKMYSGNKFHVTFILIHPDEEGNNRAKTKRTKKTVSDVPFTDK
jgi:hypothetical protein